ncbi:MAG: hypothetical protein M1840_001920 [Geoglossum simile]|nr:MAG: hypothetical protein M1840_001920 [Geoglossum simile]
MADENIPVGDEVSWKRSNGGTVEAATSSAIVIEPGIGNTTKNAGEGNHAVQDGNDVVERPSGLEKEGGGGDEGNEKQGDKKEPDTGEKRGRGDAGGGLEIASGEGHKSAEGAEGRDSKKPKTEVEGAGTKNGSIKIDGSGEKKDDKQDSEGLTVKVARKEESAPKKRGPGRPKKSESKIEKTAASVKETKNSDSIGRRTRSKA